MSDPKTACYFKTQPDGTVLCGLCPHHCHIRPGGAGICRVRRNQDGQLIAGSYGQITSIALDPIEKKPLAFYHPGRSILSIGSWGCNLHCRFCQNWQIAQQTAPFRQMTPQEISVLARDYVPQGNLGVAYTYNEPFISYEFLLDCARLVRADGLKNIVVTNGYIEEEPLEEILSLIDAMNIDLKAWNQAFYDDLCGGEASVIRRNIERCSQSCHVEVTTLLIPGRNDNSKDIEALAKWLADIDPRIPLHLTRHHPAYKMTEPDSIAPEHLRLLADLAARHLKHVNLGNLMV